MPCAEHLRANMVNAGLCFKPVVHIAAIERMHQAGAADAASPLTWTWAKWIDTFQWLDAQRTAGNIEIKCWGRAYADSVGVGYAK